MSSPDQNRLTIRLEISAPAGVSVSPAGLLPQPGRTRDGGIILNPLFDPVSPLALACHPVAPESGTSLGRISAQISYPTNPPDSVKALVTPLLLWHDHDQPPLNAVPGQSNDNKSLWSWGTATDNPLRGVDHIPTDNGSFNVLSVWRKNTAQADYTSDGILLFYGKTGPCGSGSGSGSGPMSPLVAPELADSPRLLMVVPDGPNAGHYAATPVAPLRWRVQIQATAYELSTTDGTAFVLRGPSGSAVSTATGFRPFSAMFPGAVVGAAHAVVVVRA